MTKFTAPVHLRDAEIDAASGAGTFVGNPTFTSTTVSANASGQQVAIRTETLNSRYPENMQHRKRTSGVILAGDDGSEIMR